MCSKAPHIENVHNFCDSYKALLLYSLRTAHFFELADNRLLNCTPVVDAGSPRKGALKAIVCWLLKDYRITGTVFLSLCLLR